MKRFELEQDDPEETEDIVDQEDSNFDDTDTMEEVIPPSQKATWREIEKRRELLALSRMIGESLDDQIFN